MRFRCGWGVVVLAMAAAWPAASAEWAGRATVTDGDTLTVAGKRIRLWGLDAPESAQQCTGGDGRAWPCGRRAAAALDGHVMDRTVRCVQKDTDRYGRIVAECFVQGQSINRWLVGNGWAVAYRAYSLAYVADEDQARRSQRNIWQGPFQMPAEYRRSQRSARSALPARPARAPSPPAARGNCSIKGNISSDGSRIYHMPGQRDYERTRIHPEQGERMFCSEAEATSAGWRPAKR